MRYHLQDRTVPRRHRGGHPSPASATDAARRGAGMDWRKVSIVAVALLAAALLPAQSDARTDVPVVAAAPDDAVEPISSPSTGTLTQQILQSIRHLQEPAAIVDGITAPATATAAAERLTPPQPIVEPTVEDIIRDVWPDQLEDRAVRIAWRESRFVPTAHNSCCWGTYQLFWSVHRSWLADYGVTDPYQLLDARTNIEMAYVLYQRAGGFGPWST